MNHEKDNEKVCLYVVTENRHLLLTRMLASVLTSSYLPDTILIISPDRDFLDSMQFHMIVKAFKQVGIIVDCIVCLPEEGLSARKNKAIKYMEHCEYAYGLSIDDDMVLDPFCIERLLESFQGELFAVGPTVLQPDGKGLPSTTALASWPIAEVDAEGVWNWRGFIQGIDPKELPDTAYDVAHLAGCYLHRIIPGHYYDLYYDRPGFFMHESDFVYGKPLMAKKDAVVHHWPILEKSLWQRKEQNESEILANVRYFARKHGLGEVTEINWEGFEEVDQLNTAAGTGIPEQRVIAT